MRARRAVATGALALVVVLGSTPRAAGATEAPDEQRRDPKQFLALAPTEEDAPGFLPVTSELVRPGQRVGFPEPLVNDIVGSRRYVSAAALSYESVDGSLLLSVSIVDLGDPRVLATVGTDGWTEALGDEFPAGAQARPDEDPDDTYAELGVAWTKGPLLVVVVVNSQVKRNSRADVLATIAPITQAIAAKSPDLPVVTPARPATPNDEAAALGEGIIVRTLGLLSVRWLYTWGRDRAAQRRLRAWVDRDVGRPPPPADPYLTDVTRPATAYLWATRLLGAAQVVALLLFMVALVAVVVLVNADQPVRPERLMIAVGFFTAVWLGAPKAVGVVCGVLSRGGYRPAVTGGEKHKVGRWLAAPVAGTVALVGILLSLALAAVGLALVLRAVAVEKTGAWGAVGPGETQDVRSGYVMFAILVLAISALPYSLARRAAQRSVQAALGGDKRDPILLLRSFADDKLKMRAHRNARQHPLTRLRPSSRDRFEEIIVWTLWRSGPVTALSKPGSRLQPLGAVRVHYSNEEWPDAVRHRIRASALVVLIVDDTRHVADEIDMIREEGAMDRALFVVPPVPTAERRKRVRWLEDLLGTGRVLSRLDRATDVLVARMTPVGEIHAVTARFREDLAYEIALERSVTAAHDPQPKPADTGPQALDRPPDRQGRPKEPRTWAGWAGSLVLLMISTATDRITPDVEIPDVRTADVFLDLPGPVRQFASMGDYRLIVPMTRDILVVATGPTEDGWNHELTGDEHIRTAVLGPDVVALSTFDSPVVTLLDVDDGSERAAVDLGESVGALAVTEHFVAAVRSEAGELVVMDHDGVVVGTVEVSGVPTSLAATDTRIVVAGARTSTLDVVDLADTAHMARRSIEVGPGLRSVAVVGDTAFVTRPEAGEVVAVDLRSATIKGRVTVPGLFPGLSRFSPTIAADAHHVVVPVYPGPGRGGLVVIEPASLDAADPWWVGLIGLPSELAVDDDTVYTGFSDADGVYGWALGDSGG